MDVIDEGLESGLVALEMRLMALEFSAIDEHNHAVNLRNWRCEEVRDLSDTL